MGGSSNPACGAPADPVPRPGAAGMFASQAPSSGASSAPSFRRAAKTASATASSPHAFAILAASAASSVASRVVSPASRRCPAGFSPNLRQFCTRTPPATRRTPSAMRRFGIPRGSRTPPKSSEAPSACSMAHVGQGHAKGARASMRLPDRSVIRFRRACTSRIRTACRRSRLPWGGA